MLVNIDPYKRKGSVTLSTGFPSTRSDKIGSQGCLARMLVLLTLDLLGRDISPYKGCWCFGELLSIQFVSVSSGC